MMGAGCGVRGAGCEGRRCLWLRSGDAIFNCIVKLRKVEFSCLLSSDIPHLLLIVFTISMFSASIFNYKNIFIR